MLAHAKDVFFFEVYNAITATACTTTCALKL